jgi:SAM-dependent methyltransferase
MDVADAGRLIAPAVRVGERWADLGAGTGTFTEALARLVGVSGEVIAVERDPSRVRTLEQLARQRSREPRAPIVVRRADFTDGLDVEPLDGVLLANALHFVPATAQAETLRRLASALVEGGRVVIVEYDKRAASRWVPFPVSRARLAELAREAGLGTPEVIGEIGSAFGGTMYASVVYGLE